MSSPFNNAGGSSGAWIHSSITWDDEVQFLFSDIEEERNLVGVWVTMLTPDPTQNPVLPERFSQFLLLRLVTPSIRHIIHLFP